MMLATLLGSYGEETREGRGQIGSLRWWKVANQDSERVRSGN